MHEVRKRKLLDSCRLSGCCKSQQKNLGKFCGRHFGGLVFSACHGNVMQLAAKIGKEDQQSNFIALLLKVQNRVAWIEAIKRNNCVPIEYSRVCSAQLAVSLIHL